MGGKITVNSIVNVGTQFIITLQPLSKDYLVIKQDQLQLSNEEKLAYLKSIGAFQFTEDFNLNFDKENNLDNVTTN